MKNKIENKIGYLVAGSMLLGSLLVVGTAFEPVPVSVEKWGDMLLAFLVLSPQ